MNSTTEERRQAHSLVAEAKRAMSDGDSLRAEHRFRDALAAFVLLDDPAAAARVLASLADLRLSAGDFGEAFQLGRQALDRAPGDVHVLTGLGYAQWLSGSPADGEVTFAQALRQDGAVARALAGRGQVQVELGEYRAALADLGRALDLGLPHDDETDVRSARALALAGLGRLAEAEAELAAAVERAPGRPRTRLRAAQLAALAGRPDQARQQFRELAGLTDPRASAEARTARRHLTRLDRRTAASSP
ncbi:tetratricopeptide repeat protein [Spirillospora sp. CA-294931]|uniref:tetratricopeptide repeat protein n=1 Tax=Spirillospora sp. CA-294931 TaxID=3240042 RepID=UPI003D91ECBC